MTWNASDPQGKESAKIRWEIVPYTRGRVLDIGCGAEKTFPHFIGVDNGHHAREFNWPIKPDVSCEAEKLDIFADASCDAVFSSHLLEHIPYEKVPATLREWCRVVKDGGYLVLYLPDEDDYPKVGEEGANPDHKWDVNYDRIVAAMESLERGWDLIDFQKRNEGFEYSIFMVFKLGSDGHSFDWKTPKPTQKRAAVIRYGAFGDAIMASSIFPALKEQGYHVTLYCGHSGYEVTKHDPHVDHFYLQDTDQVPNPELKSFWDWEAKKYDKFINLSESVEGAWLGIPGRSNHSWPHNVRKKRLNVNYIEHAHDMADVPLPPRGRFYPTPDEKAWASAERAKMGDKVVLWSLAGSSVHKCWPHMDQIIARIMLSYRDTHIVMVGDEFCKLLEMGWQKEPRIHCRSGVWSIRQSMTFCEKADLIIGTETGLLNGASMLPVPKICMLSHSTKENLTKHWKNTRSLTPVDTPCYPCHRMHYNWDYCVKVEENGQALCMNNVLPETVWTNIVDLLGKVDVSRETIVGKQYTLRQKPMAGAISGAMSDARIF